MQPCFMVTLYHLLYEKCSDDAGAPWNDVDRAISIRHADVFFVLSVYLALVRSKMEGSGGL